MLGVHINPVLDFKEHYAHITKDVRKLATALNKRKLSPGRKILVIDQLLKSKYHATHLGIFTQTQLTNIDKILNKVARQSLGVTPGFPTEAIHNPTTELGLGLDSIIKRAIIMGTEHLINTSNKPTERGHIANMHNIRLLHTYQHWPSEAIEHHLARLPTLRVHRYIDTVGIELENLPSITTPNNIADTLRTASISIDAHRASCREHITTPMHTPEYHKELRKKCLPLHFHTKLLKHLTPLWASGVTKWENILIRTPNTTPLIIQMLPAKAIHATLPSGDLRPPTDLIKTLHTLRTILSVPADTEHRTLPNDTTNTPQIVHPLAPTPPS
jgi:hypothetical protein